MRYHDTYWYAQVVFRTLADQKADYFRTLNEFFGDENYPRLVQPFPKWTLLHDYILFSILRVEFEQMPSAINEHFLKWHEKDYGPPVYATPIEYQLAEHDIAHVSFVDWAASKQIDLLDADADHFVEYHGQLGGFDVGEGRRHAEGPRGELYERLTDEVFFLAFMNRELLVGLQRHTSFQISELDLRSVDSKFRELFARDGVLKRVHIPKWAKDAVFFRDRGRCVLCNRDLTNLITTQNDENYDHIMPLASGGSNDVTNLQLLCVECNSKKSAGSAATRNIVEKWF